MPSVYEIVTERIVDKLEQGVVPWRKTWGTKLRMPVNLTSHKQYRGVNVFLLALAGYESPYWLTYKQAQDVGGQVRKGERSMPVVFWSKVNVKDKQTGDKVEVPLLRYYSAFNVAQCELPAGRVPQLDTVANAFAPIEACHAIVSGFSGGPQITHGHDKAAYAPSADRVLMPRPEAFDNVEAYYAALFHELTHATGHESRLARKGITDRASFGSDPYGREELIAEMGAAFLCVQAGIDAATVDNAASYLAGWLKIIKQDAKLVVTAAAQAQKAADLILGKTWDNAEEKAVELVAA